MNRLRDATSPYLLQHADNPVDWWPWGPAAFAEAKRRDVPVLISVGYAACHWCHVMAHESFEDTEVAAVLNAMAVPIKVDREERPDVDAVYMTATQAMTGQGGWPMTVFATPEGQPFYCGTYFPKPHFLRLIDAVAQAWRDQPGAVREQGAAVVEAIAESQGRGLPTASVSPDVLEAAASTLHKEHDETYGGFGGAPKFPPHMALLFLLRHYQRTGDEGSLEVVRHTCEAMARGGIYDQLAGGFARYSVDPVWLVPHFEKMLYDNALLLRVYTTLWRLADDPMAERIATETAEFLVRDLYDGAFLSSLDADTDGMEGRTYVWTPDQLREVLGDEDGAWAADLFDVTTAGTFEHGTSVLRLARDLDARDSNARDSNARDSDARDSDARDSDARDSDARDSDELDALRERWMSVRARLSDARDRRPQPARDDKVVAAWAGLAVTAMAEFAALTDDPRWTDAAVGAADFLATRHVVDGRLRRASRNGRVGEPAGVLDDYGCVAEAFCAVHQLTGEGRWLDLARQLLDTALDRFKDGDGFFDTADDAESLVARPADPTDNATPSGLAALCAALVTYTALTGQVEYREAAERALATVTAIMVRHPRYAGYASAVAEALVSGPYEIAIAGPAGPARATLARVARREAPPGAVVVVGPPDQPGVPLLAGRPLVGGEPAAYVCRGFVCDRPVTTGSELTELMRR